MERERLPKIGIKDRTGEEIRLGDIFEYENLYIVLQDKGTKETVIYEYENQVEYGVEQEPYYLLIGTHSISDLDLQNDQIKGNIFIDAELRSQLHREIE